MSKKNLTGSEKRKKKRKWEEDLIRSRWAIDKFVLKNVGSDENIDQLNENMNNENHTSENETMELIIQVSLLLCQMHPMMKILTWVKNNQFPH